ncbi:MAG TPA: cytochrome P450 [Terriglobales bacterium]|nr:cytochrome P450 [Terriglobales bacterium]
MNRSQAPQAPGPGTLSFFSDLGKFRRDPLGKFFEYTLRFGDVVRYRGLWTTHQITNPEHILKVLQTNAANYRKGRDYKILRLSLGQGLLTSEGALWQRQRRMTQPMFQSQQVASSIGIMTEAASSMCERWSRFSAEGRAFDIVPELMRLTLLIAGRAMFSVDLEAETKAIQEVLQVGREFSVERAWSVIRVPHWMPTTRNRRHRSSLGKFRSIVDRILEQRRGTPEPPHDLLWQLMSARDESGAAMPDDQVRDEVATLLTAGHETTTLALAWALFLLAQDPRALEAVLREIAFLNGRAPGYEDLSRLKYTRNVVDETMRLYPPVWVISRTAIADDLIGGFRVPAGSEILIFPYITHRHPRWWADPEKFLPERFAAENSRRPVRGAYLPFGAGPRTCVGLNFAMTEILVVLAILLQRFRPELAMIPENVKLDPSVTLRPDPGIMMRMVSR